jgi:hypothetical protein
MDFAKKMNQTWTSYGDDAFEPNFEAQASAFFDLASSIENAKDEVPDNNRVLRKPKDELVIVDINVQMPTCVNKQKVKEEPTASDEDVASQPFLPHKDTARDLEGEKDGLISHFTYGAEIKSLLEPWTEMTWFRKVRCARRSLFCRVEF